MGVVFLTKIPFYSQIIAYPEEIATSFRFAPRLASDGASFHNFIIKR